LAQQSSSPEQQLQLDPAILAQLLSQPFFRTLFSQQQTLHQQPVLIANVLQVSSQPPMQSQEFQQQPVHQQLDEQNDEAEEQQNNHPFANTNSVITKLELLEVRLLIVNIF